MGGRYVCMLPVHQFGMSLAAHWDRWRREEDPPGEFRLIQDDAEIRCVFLRQLAAHDAGFDLIRPSLAGESDPRFALLRVIEVVRGGSDALGDLFQMAGRLGLRGVIIDTWRNPEALEVDVQPWNPTARYDGLHIHLTAVGRVIQAADDLIMSYRIRGRPSVSRADAVLRNTAPRTLYLPWIQAIQQVCHATITTPMVEFASDTNQLVRGRCRLVDGVLEFQDLLFRAGDATMADFGIYAIQELGRELSATKIRLPLECALYTRCSHPEEDFVAMSEAEEKEALLGNGSRSLVLLPPLPHPPAVPRPPDVEMNLDALRFGDRGAEIGAPTTPLERALSAQRQWPTWRLLLPGPLSAPHPLVAAGIWPDPSPWGWDTMRLRSMRLLTLWDHLLGLQVVEPPALQRKVTVELAVDYGIDASLKLLLFQLPAREMHQLLQLSSGEQEPIDVKRPVRLLRIAAYNHPMVRTQPAVRAEAAADLLLLLRLVGLFLTHNHHDLGPCKEDRYRIAAVVDDSLYQFGAERLFPTSTAWHEMPEFISGEGDQRVRCRVVTEI